MDESTAYIFYLAIGPFLLCFLLQYGAGRLKNPSFRRWLSLPLPILCSGVFLLSLYKTTVITGWDVLGWTTLACITGFALAGVGLGWLLTKNRWKE